MKVNRYREVPSSESIGKNICIPEAAGDKQDFGSSRPLDHIAHNSFLCSQSHLDFPSNLLFSPSGQPMENNASPSVNPQHLFRPQTHYSDELDGPHCHKDDTALTSLSEFVSSGPKMYNCTTESLTSTILTTTAATGQGLESQSTEQRQRRHSEAHELSVSSQNPSSGTSSAAGAVQAAKTTFRQSLTTVSGRINAGLASGASNSTVESPVSSLVKQRLKDCVLNKRRSKEGAASACVSFLSPSSVDTEEPPGEQDSGTAGGLPSLHPWHQKPTLGGSDSFDSAYATSAYTTQPSRAASLSCCSQKQRQSTLGRKSHPFSEAFAVTATSSGLPWVLTNLCASQAASVGRAECLYPVIGGVADTASSRQSSSLLRKTMSEPSLKVRNSALGVKHRSGRNERRNLNPLAAVAAVVAGSAWTNTNATPVASLAVSTIPPPGAQLQCAHSISGVVEGGDVLYSRGPTSSSRQAPVKTSPMTQPTPYRLLEKGVGQENDVQQGTQLGKEVTEVPMEVASDNESTIDSPPLESAAKLNNKISDVEMNLSVPTMNKELNSNTKLAFRGQEMQQLISSLVGSSGSVCGDVRIVSQDYLRAVHGLIKQERDSNPTKMGTKTVTANEELDTPEEKNSAPKPSQSEGVSGKATRGRQAACQQAPQRRYRQVSGLLSRTRSAPIRLTGNAARSLFGHSNSFENNTGSGGLLSAASIVAMEAAAAAAAVNSTSSVCTAASSSGTTGKNRHCAAYTSSVSTASKISGPEEEQRLKIMQQLRKKLLEK
ncbi:unnamed protein product [Schistocephalus solidus]|uniref:Non-specific serine/threonine protein kinase n=1 Tax=Schistocephalus solidus TaxID=70667 RepID=A0A183TFH6_SCHSO|nr:unnamed protein product [Schistocephalus solidus]